MGYANFIMGALDLLIFLIPKLYHVELLDYGDSKNSLVSRIVNLATELRVCMLF